MGLDMYAHKIRASLIGDQQVDIDVSKALGLPEPEKDATPDVRQATYELHSAIEKLAKAKGDYETDFAYWRKFNNLHGWMRDLYKKKGGTSEDFNCDSVRLMPEDIKQLRKDCKSLEPTEGFFFGVSEPMSEDDIELVKSFCRKCDQAFKEGYAVFYTSWW